jgi:hypothetical protein
MMGFNDHLESDKLKMFSPFIPWIQEEHTMSPTLWSSQPVLDFLMKHFKLATLVMGVFILSVMLAEGCVKRPDFEPASGVSPKTLG